MLPSSSLLSRDDSPDRRSTFRIRRVSVDGSGAKIVTTVEVDQASNALAALIERSAAAAELVA